MLLFPLLDTRLVPIQNIRSVHGIFDGKPNKQKPVRRPRSSRMTNSKMILMDTGSQIVNCIEVAKNMAW